MALLGPKADQEGKENEENKSFSQQISSNFKAMHKIERGNVFERNIPTIGRKFKKLRMRPTLLTRGKEQIAVFNSWNKQDRLNYEQKKSNKDIELDEEASKELPNE